MLDIRDRNGELIRLSVPGRICMHGEHQDFLGLSVIAMAIDLYFTMKAWPRDDNPLRNAPHTAHELALDWAHPYSREQAAFPVPGLREAKFWPAVKRIDAAHGDRNLVCTCPPLEEYA